MRGDVILYDNNFDSMFSYFKIKFIFILFMWNILVRKNIGIYSYFILGIISLIEVNFKV